MMACFVDNAELPITCAWDDDSVYNCIHASCGVKRNDCQFWQPERARQICADILEES